METGNYETRFVAFIDLLGFKEIVQKMEQILPEKQHDFYRVNSILNFLHDESIESDGTHDLFTYEEKDGNLIERQSGDLRMNYISDCMVISSSCDQQGVISICNKISKFVTDLATDGIFVRGGITIGNLYHHGPILFGSAYQRAYLLEHEVAVFPRIVMDEAAYQKASELIENQTYLNTFILTDSDSRKFLNPFPINYFPYRMTDWMNFLLLVKGQILYHLNFFDPDVSDCSELERLAKYYGWAGTYGSIRFEGGQSKVFEKYMWLKDKYNENLRKWGKLFQLNISPIFKHPSYWGPEEDRGILRKPLPPDEGSEEA